MYFTAGANNIALVLGEKVENFNPNLVSGKTDVGPMRLNNQDAFLLPDSNTPTNLGAFYVVADGVGGQEFGEDAARIGVASASETFYQVRQQDVAIPEALEKALCQANKAIYEEAQRRGSGHMGCTMVAAAQQGDTLFLAHVGDTRAYLLQEGRLRQMTRDDTWVQNQVDAGRLSPEEAARHELRNVVTQVLGNKLEVKIHLSQPHKLKPDSVLLLCSDGLYDPVNDAQIAQIILESKPHQAAEALIQAAIAAQTTDNITAVVVHCGHILAAPEGKNSRKLLPLGIAGFILLLALALSLPGFLPNAARSENFRNALPTLMPVMSLPEIPTGEPQEDGMTTAVPLPTPTSTTTPAPTPTAEPEVTWYDGRHKIGRAAN